GTVQASGRVSRAITNGKNLVGIRTWSSGGATRSAQAGEIWTGCSSRGSTGCGVDFELVAAFGNRGQRVHHPGTREGGDHLGAEAQLGKQVEPTLVQIHDLLNDRQAEAGALFGCLVCQ